MPLLLVLVFLCAVPDAVVVPVLRDLLSDRYGASPVEAQAFLAINLIGLVAAAPVAAWLRRRWSPRRVLLVGALADALLLAALAAPVGLGWTLAIRAAEGLPDALVFGELFALVGAVGEGSVRVRRYGAASTTLMLAIGLGIAAGGIAARHSGPAGVYIVGIAANLLLATLAARCRIPQRDVPAANDPTEARQPAEMRSRRPLWPALAMAFADRATGGAVTSVLPLFLDRLFGATPSERGWMVGLPMVLMALGAAPAASVASAVGVRRVRLVAAVVYALALIALALVSPERALLIPLLVILGVAGSALLPTSLAIAARSRRGCQALAGFAGAGGVGQAMGLLVPLVLFAGLTATIEDVRMLLASFGLLHLACTVAALAPMVIARERLA